MRVIKTLDLFILKKFALVFTGAFFIVLFVFMMQFTWRYVDELIGKGLSLEILAQFFWYMSITLVATSLPLAILLASLIAFGNMGEQLELLAMKAAGVPLIRIMRPLIIVVVVLSGTSFYFQNYIGPWAHVKLQTLLISMKQTSPAVEIPEGVFYSGVPNVNLYVQEKNAETGMLYQVIIYKTDRGFDRAQIVLADSGRMEMTADKMHLVLDLWNGEQFENLQGQNAAGLSSASVPYDRETFGYKRFLIDFDSNFSMMDANMLRNMPVAKNMKEIEESVDSMQYQLDSVGNKFYSDLRITYFPTPNLPKSAAKAWTEHSAKSTAHFDSLFARLPADERIAVNHAAGDNVRALYADLEWKKNMPKEGGNFIRRHWIEWHQKMSLSLACIFFFFVGAPLGAIIRKGGLGMPTVISLLIFIIYYTINTSSMKLARDGKVEEWYGMWISTIILTPLGIFLTYKANKDSGVFNMEVYTEKLKRLLGLRSQRHIFRKEVIIEDPDYDRMATAVAALREGCIAYNEANSLLKAPSYVKTFFRHQTDTRIEELGEQMEAIIEELSNSRSNRILQELNNLPIIFVRAHTSPFNDRRLNIAAGIIFPVGIVLWLRIWRFRLRLLRDLRQIVKSCDSLLAFIQDFKK